MTESATPLTSNANKRARTIPKKVRVADGTLVTGTDDDPLGPAALARVALAPWLIALSAGRR